MSVAPWISVLSWHIIHKDGDIFQIYFCVIFCETRHHAQAHATCGALCLCVSFLWPQEKHGQQRRQVYDFAGQCLLWLLLLGLAVVVVPLVLFPQTSLQHR